MLARGLLLAWLILSGTPITSAESAAGQLATVETTADAAIKDGHLEANGEVLTAGAPGTAILLRFRVAVIEKWTVRKAVVALHLPSGEPMPTTVQVGVMAAGWKESSPTAPEVPQTAQVITRELKGGWFSFEVPAAAASALASGRASSLAIVPTPGTHLAIHSRRTIQFMPYLLVRGAG